MKILVDILSDSLMQRIGWALIHFLWQGTALALLLAIALQLLRHRSVQSRWILACVALGLMVMLPVVTAYMVSVDIPNVAEIEPLTEATTLPDSTPLVAAETELPFVAVGDPASPEVPSELPGDGAGLASTTPWLQQAKNFLHPILPWGVLVWLLGVVGISLWHFGGWLLLEKTKRLGTRPVAPAIRNILDQLLQRLRISRPIRLLESARVAVPVVVGWIRPVVLLPASVLSGLTPSQLEAILAHELAHIRRFDCLVKLIQAVIETFLFYHPAVWWVSGRIRQESEHCCDELAVEICPDRKGYAHALARIAELTSRKPRLAAAASGGKLLPRIRRIVGCPDGHPGSGVRWLAAVLVIACLITAGFFIHDDSASANTKQSSLLPAPMPDALPGDLLLYYSFSTDGGDQVVDISDHGYRGQVHGARHTVDEVRGGAMSFDGHDDYISIPELGLKEYSFAAWVKTSVTGGSLNNRRIFMLDAGEHYYAIQGNVGGGFGTYVTEQMEFNEYDWQFVPNVWAHIAVTFDGSTVKIYINGELTETGDTGLFSITRPLTGEGRIGGNATFNGGFWHGMIDEVAVFSRALTEQEVAQVFEITSPATGKTAPRPSPAPDTSKKTSTPNWRRNLVLYYSFEQPDTSQIIDVSGNRNHGKIHGATYGTDQTDGKCMTFDGLDDHVSIPGIHLQNFTFSAVVKAARASGQTDNRRLFLLDGDKGYYALETNTEGRLAFQSVVHGRKGEPREIREHSGPSKVDSWDIIAVTCNGSTVRLYRNGRPVGQGSILADDVAGTAHLAGTDAHHGQFWKGMIDDVCLFNKALTAQEIKDLHRITAERTLPSHLSPPKEKQLSPELFTLKVPQMSEDVVLYYNFDTNLGDMVVDLSGGNHHARAYGTKYVGDGRVGGALLFDGEDDFLSTQNIHLENFTFSAFVKTLLPANKANTNNRRLFLLYDGPRYYALQGNSGGSVGLDVTGHRGVEEYDWRFKPNTWTHIAVTYDKPTVRIYKNGELTETGHVDVDGVRGTLFIGGTEKHWGRFWHGMIDEVRLFKRALNDSEIKHLYKQGIPDVSPEPAEKRDVGTGIKLEPRDFEGMWSGLAVDKAEDGTSSDGFTVQIKTSDEGQLTGLASGTFVRRGSMELKNVQVKGDQLDFEVLHRSGIWMQITLRLIEGKLQGEGIPVDFDLGVGDRCDITLVRPGSEAELTLPKPRPSRPGFRPGRLGGPDDHLR